MLKVVIVDDEYYIRYGLEQTVPWDEFGIEVAGSAANGEEALKLINRTLPQIVITDVKMPGMGGIELLKEIRSRFPRIRVIVISGHNDFGYVKEALVYGVENYILKPIDSEEISETLLNTINKIETEENDREILPGGTDIIRENILYRLVTNSISPAEAEERFDTLQIDMGQGSYQTGIIRFFKSPALTAPAPESLPSRIRSEQPLPLPYHCFSDLSGNLIVLFTPDTPPGEGEAEAALDTLAQWLRKEYGADLFITLSESVSGMERIPQSYRECLELQRHVYTRPPNRLLRKSDLSRQEEKHIPALPIEELRDALLSGDRPLCESFFANLRMSWQGADGDHVKSLILELTAEIISLVREHNLDREGLIIRNPRLYEELFGKNREEALNWLEEAVRQIGREIEQNRRNPKSLADRVIEYVDTHYTEPISLKTLAADFDVNPSYLGQKLKGKTGKLFSDYLNGKRIEKARELMEDPRLKANSIALAVGYSDADYFYKVFKKYTGLYPQDYKSGLDS